MIRAILLDLGRVIVPFDFNIGYRALEARCGLRPDLLRERIRETGLVPEFETGLVEPHDFVNRLSEALEIKIPYSDFCQIWSSIFSRETLLSGEFLQRLHARYPLVLVSNTNAIHFEMIRETYPILEHFDRLILSYEVKCMKPGRAIYEAAISAAGHPAEQCFFTDDIPEYVEGARRLGIQAFPFLNAEQLENDLRSVGVTW